MQLGARWSPETGCELLVWAPRAARVEVHVFAPEQRLIAMEPLESGYHACTADLPPGTLYKYRLDGREEWPDPASRAQPEGVHGPSAVLKSDFPWQDQDWRGLPGDHYILYELHVGSYTREGTFAALSAHLDELVDLGITAVELMPLAQFPGERNWGYDGVYPFAVQNSYGGAEGLKALVDAAHRKGLAVVLDVVYNHLGPEGNYLSKFGPYFTDKHRTPWGKAIDFECPAVRRYFIENARQWISEFHLDALRLDATHAIFDDSPVHILEEIGIAAHQAGRESQRIACIFAESDQNDARLVRDIQAGGMGLDAVWSDDLHHSLHVLLTGERSGYYADFYDDPLRSLAKVLREGFAYTGQHSFYRGRVHGTPARDIPASRFIVCSQNHDQVGNRMLGDRLTTLVPFEDLKLAAGVVLLSPFIPLLFMGEEYGEPARFPYFVSHSDAALIEAVRQGRRREFAAFVGMGEAPDPQSEATFESACLDHAAKLQGHHCVLLGFYRELLRLRKSVPALRALSKEDLSATALEHTLVVSRGREPEPALLIYNFGREPYAVECAAAPGRWDLLLDSAAAGWMGGGSQNPPSLVSRGTLAVTLAPRSFCAISRRTAG